MLLAQLSDTHLIGDPDESLWGHNTTHSLAAVLDALPDGIDVLVVTGDLSDDGSRRSYQRLESMTATVADKRFFLPGNHDDATVMSEVFGNADALELVPISTDWTLALLNSRWIDHDAGLIGSETLGRLRDELAHVDSHVAVCLHHPPVSPCPSENCGLSDGDRLQTLLQEASNVRVVLSGHVHKAFDRTVAGVRYLGAPSTFRQLEHGGDPHYRDPQLPPAARIVNLLASGEIEASIVRAAATERPRQDSNLRRTV